MSDQSVQRQSIQLIATDLDGTFLGSQHELLTENVEAVRYAASLGIVIVFATGRPARWTSIVQSLADIHPLLIASNGGLILRPDNGDVVKSWPLDRSKALAFGHDILKLVPDAGFCVEYAHIGWGCNERYVRGNDPLDMTSEQPDVVAELSDLLDADEAVKLLVSSPTIGTEQLAGLVSGPATGRLNPTFSFIQKQGMVECSAPGVSKASALRDVLDNRKIDSAKTLAFGDMPNDLPMLSLVGNPFVMANGHRSVLNAGFRVAGNNADGAVGKVIHQFLEGSVSLG